MLVYQWWYPSWLPVPPLSEADLYLHPAAGKESCPGLSSFGNFACHMAGCFWTSQKMVPKRWETHHAFHKELEKWGQLRPLLGGCSLRLPGGNVTRWVAMRLPGVSWCWANLGDGFTDHERFNVSQATNYPKIDGGNMEVMKNNEFIFTPKVGVYWSRGGYLNLKTFHCELRFPVFKYTIGTWHKTVS